MSKVTRKRLARGTKLTVQHTHSHLVDIASEISNSNITQDQLKNGWAEFTVAIFVPLIDYPFFKVDQPIAGGAEDRRPFAVPFILLPFQEHLSFSFRNQYSITYDTPKIILTEASLSFDTRDEPATILSPYHETGNGDSAQAGYCDYTYLDAYDIAFALRQKDIWYMKDSLWEPDRELFNVDISSLALTNRFQRANPFVLDGMYKPINPYKSLTAFLYCQRLQLDTDIDTVTEHAIVSAWMNFTFITNLVERDVHAAIPPPIVQNIPSSHDGTAASRVVTTAVPLANATIEAENGVNGISLTQHTIDRVHQDKFQGGYTQQSDVRPVQDLLHDAAYDVITIPLMNNRRLNGVSSDSCGDEPYMVAGPLPSQQIVDHRLVKVTYPFTIHHVILAWNWQEFWDTVTNSAIPNIPASVDWQVEVGLNLMSGVRGDLLTFEPIAYRQLINPKSGWTGTLIDRIRAQDSYATWPAPAPTGYPPGWNWELHQVPLYTNGGVGLYTQGEPFFVGEANSRTQARENTDFTGGTPITDGCERYLYARMRIRDGVRDLIQPALHEIYTGYGGHYMYLLCKKHLVGHDGQ